MPRPDDEVVVAPTHVGSHEGGMGGGWASYGYADLDHVRQRIRQECPEADGFLVKRWGKYLGFLLGHF